MQGLTEFLPISSSAHVRIVGELIGTGADPGAAYTAIIQIGTELAVVVYFLRDIVRIIKQWFLSLTGRVPRNDPDARMGWLIIVGSLPIVILGVLLQHVIETSFRSLYIVAIMLIVFGILLGIADKLGRREKTLQDLSWRDGILYGLAQALALIPGVSRSGGTTTMGRALGYERPAAARYSFLLAVPAVFGSGLYELAKVIGKPTEVGALETGVSTVIAFVVGITVIHYLLKYISHRSFMPFVVYRVVLGVVLLVLLGTGAITA